MLKTVSLLLPALIPSWRFFDAIAPSPRIEFTLLKSEQESPEHWQEFRPRPVLLPFGGMVKNLFWSPRWNEALFLVSCAERLLENPTGHSAREILMRIKAGLMRDNIDMTGKSYLQYRLVSLSRDGQQMQRHITFISPVHPL